MVRCTIMTQLFAAASAASFRCNSALSSIENSSLSHDQDVSMNAGERESDEKTARPVDSVPCMCPHARTRMGTLASGVRASPGVGVRGRRTPDIVCVPIVPPVFRLLWV